MEGLDMTQIEALKTCAFSFDGIHVTRVEQGDVYELDDKQAKEAILYDNGGWFRLYEEDTEETEPKPESTPEPEPSKAQSSGGKKGKGKTSTRSRSAKERKTASKKD